MWWVRSYTLPTHSCKEIHVVFPHTHEEFFTFTQMNPSPGYPAGIFFSEFFVEALSEKYDSVRVHHPKNVNWTTMTCDGDEWKRCWYPLSTTHNKYQYEGFKMSFMNISTRTYIFYNTLVESSGVVLWKTGKLEKIDLKNWRDSAMRRDSVILKPFRRWENQSSFTADSVA